MAWAACKPQLGRWRSRKCCGKARFGFFDHTGCNGQDRTTVIQTNAATQELLFDRGLCKTEERIAPWKRLRKQLGKLSVESLKPVLSIESIREKAIILRLGQG